MNPPTWRTQRLPDRCANLACESTPGNVTPFVLATEERRSDGPPLTLYVCAPCAAVLRGEQT